jgi:hypothetical protein
MARLLANTGQSITAMHWIATHPVKDFFYSEAAAKAKDRWTKK